MMFSLSALMSPALKRMALKRMAPKRTTLKLPVLVASALVVLLPLTGTAARAETLSQPCIAADRVKEPEATFYFPVDSVVPPARDRKALDRLAYNAKYKLKICVIGQADKQGNQKYNRMLSQKRAQAIADDLIRNGVSRQLIEAGSRGEAFGDSMFDNIVKNGQDRRVDVYFVE